MATVLVAGFGPFLDVVDNPAAALARALDGAVLGDDRVVEQCVLAGRQLSLPTIAD